MQPLVLIFLAAVSAVALAEGQYYVPRAYYTIDPEGHASPPIPLRRLRRSLMPYPNWGGSGVSANANANAEANAWGGASANANANAIAHAGGSGGGRWGQPAPNGYGAANPMSLGAGDTRRMSGPVVGGGRSVTASSSVGLDSSGTGYYDQYTSVN